MPKKTKTKIDPRWVGTPNKRRSGRSNKQDAEDAREERKARRALRLVPIADVKELHWWRQHFATRFADGSLPQPGSALTARRFALFEIDETGGMVALGGGTNIRIESTMEAVKRARADAQTMVAISAEARRQLTSIGDVIDMVRQRLSEVTRRLPVEAEVIVEGRRTCAHPGCDNPPMTGLDLCVVHQR